MTRNPAGAPSAESELYRSAVLALGEMIATHADNAAVFAAYDALRISEQESDFFPLFGALCTALALTPAEAGCVAYRLFHMETEQTVTATELLTVCRRLGADPTTFADTGLFVGNGEQVILNPIACDFWEERRPRLPVGTSLLFPQREDIWYAGDLFAELNRFLPHYLEKTANAPLLIALWGKPGSGRKFMVQQLAAEMACCVLLVNAKFPHNATDIALAAALYNAVVCIENSDDSAQLAEILSRTGLAFSLYDGRENVLPENSAYTTLRRHMPQPGSRQRTALLMRLFAEIAFADDVVPQRDAKLNNLSPGSAKILADSLKAESMLLGKPIDKRDLLRVVSAQNPPAINGAEVLSHKGRLSDLILPAELEKQLVQICSFIQIRDIVYKSWGFADKLPWGRGISALFYGASGTGKTMAAALVANEVGLPLLRIDISQLMSKYIGETQKNIGRIFDEAEHSSCILFFDEADAVFARRTESSDAQDKYANAETAYLLQRIEAYDGVCILATNLLQNFDEAFRRRIGYMLHFPLPDATLRERIWRGIFPQDAPVEPLDYALLAQGLELSGAAIKNCALHAAYLAAADGTSITMRHIWEGAVLEYKKQGKTISPQITQMFVV